MTLETLNQRYQNILGQVVTDYIATASTVGSRQISKKLEQRLSPATVRNVLKDLEEMGYLKQPHTSAGRIPTDKGFRFYVDTFVEKNALSVEEQRQIQEEYQIGDKDVRALMQKTSRLLATLSKYVSLVAAPKLERATFKHIEFLPLSQRRLLGIFVTQTGTVENRILEMNAELNHREIEKINNYCNACFIGLTLEEARAKAAKELAQAHAEYDKLLTQALLLSQKLLSDTDQTELVVEGETELINSNEFSTLEQVQTLLNSLEEKEQLLKILDSCLESPGVRIFIGMESRCEATKNFSLITATYAKNQKLLGTLGVIGPTRMNYSKVISIVDFTAKMVSDLYDRTF